MRSRLAVGNRFPASASVGALAALAAAAAASPASLEAQQRADGLDRAARVDIAEVDPGDVVVDPALLDGLDYRSVGPSRGGRVTAVAGHRSHPGTFYMGSTGGGVWKTTDYGDAWRNLSDGYFQTASIGAIAVAESDPDVVWVGTGSDGIRSNVITGRGMYRSTDAGESWTFLGLENTGQIGSVVVHPDDPDVAWAAALGSAFGPGPDRGVYKTTDGGESWDRVLFVSDSTGAVDLELKPDDPDVIYAAMWRAERKPWTIISGAREGGLFRSTDGGESWDRLEDGLPPGLFGKADLAVSADDPDRVYALIEAPEPHEGLYRSDDAGESWRQIVDHQYLLHRPFYFTNLHADPSDADVLYAMALRFYKSTDGGEEWDRIGTPHVDDHDMWINPDDPDLFIESNDGGANVTRDGGETWSSIHNQPTAELYQVDVDDRFPYWLCAGQQDNSTICVPSLPPGSHDASENPWWRAVSGCETGPAVPKPGEPEKVYGNCKGRFSVYDYRTGQEQGFWVGGNYMYGHAAEDLEYRFQRVSPIEFSPHDPDVIYHASQYVHRTTNGGQTWETISPDLTARPEGTQGVSGEPITRDITGEEFYSTIYAVEVSPHDPDVIWVGTNDGYFQITRDGGRSWTNITPPDVPPMGRVQNIDPSPHEPGTAYYAYYRYLLDDWRPFVYRTDDYGESWELLTDGSNGIPDDYPVRVVREDPDREGLLYAGTEFGMFVSFDDGAHWQPFQLDLPVTPVTDIELYRGDLVLSTMGRGFWILDDLSPLHQVDATVASSDAHLFAPRDAYRIRYQSWGGGPASPEYLQSGALIDYWIGDEPDGEVVIEILDGDGDVVRGFSSHEDGYAWEPDGPPPMAMGQGMRGPAPDRIPGPTVETARGAHRFAWDLRFPGSWSYDDDDGEWRRGGGGPMAVPGEYAVRLTVDGRSQTRPLTVRMDPRVREAGVTIADLERQLEHNLALRDAISEGNVAARRIDALQAELEGRSGSAAERMRRELAEIEAELVTDPDDEIDQYPQPMLLDQLGYLSGMTRGADQRPGRDAVER
ncbi:MAG: WD40/YVTN/BNR-like repeat-containing protein, partial [Gemmatimonadota bacterium]